MTRSILGQSPNFVRYVIHEHSTEHYWLAVCRDQDNEKVLYYGIVNREHEVIEYKDSRLHVAKEAIKVFEESTYPKVISAELDVSDDELLLLLPEDADVTAE